MIPIRLYMGYDEYPAEIMDDIIEMLQTCFKWVRVGSIMMVEHISKGDLEDLYESDYGEAAELLHEDLFGDEDGLVSLWISGIPMRCENEY